MKDKLIWCDTKEKLEKVAQKLKSDGFSITDAETIWKSYGAESVLSVHTKEKCITYCSRDWYKMRDYEAPITANKFLGKSKSPHIVIFRRGRNVIAKDVATGNEGIAKCSPNDEFNFHTGASIALARLMSKVPATGVLNPDVRAEWTKLLGITEIPEKVFTDADRNFKVGDRVVVRDWDDMEEEYGVYPISGTIKCPNGFTKSMRHLCGRTATVVSVNGTSISVDFDDKSGDTYWCYVKHMFNPTDAPAPKKEKPEAKFKVGDYVTLKEGLTADKVYSGIKLRSGSMYDSAYHERMKVVGADWQNDLGTHYYECKQKDGYVNYYSEQMLDKWDESKIHEGDKVRIKKGCTGNRFDLYYEWVKEHISDPDLLLAFERGDHIDTSLDYEVVKIAPHKVQSRTLAYIKYKDDYRTLCYLFNIEALEKV